MYNEHIYELLFCLSYLIALHSVISSQIYFIIFSHLSQNDKLQVVSAVMLLILTLVCKNSKAFKVVSFYGSADVYLKFSTACFLFFLLEYILVVY